MSARHTFIGTYTDGDSRGIYRCRVDDATGTVSDVEEAAHTEHPSFLAVHPNGTHLYAVNEVEDGAATAYAVTTSGDLERLHRRVIGPALPCYCHVEASGRYLLIAHYTGGAVSILPIRDDGRLGEATVVNHTGSSVDPERQAAPHPHCIVAGPDNEYVYVPDLGTDEVVVYDLDHGRGSLRRRTAVTVQEGAGPRHIEFGPDGERAYLINELDSTLSVFERGASGGLDHVETVGILPDGFDGESTTADVHVHPSGEYVYGSNRGHDSIAVFAVTPTGLRLVTTESTRGEQPRSFAISSSGKFLYVANRYSDTVVPFRVDSETGTLAPAADSVTVPSPSCLVSVEAARPHRRDGGQK